MKDIEEIVNGFVEESRIDYIGIWQVRNAAQYQLEKEADQIQQATLTIIELLLNRGFQAVDLKSDGGCAPWPNQDRQSILARIKKEWSELNRPPTIGDICWFDLPDALR